jgi:hypothetical protein
MLAHGHQKLVDEVLEHAGVHSTFDKLHSHHFFLRYGREQAVGELLLDGLSGSTLSLLNHEAMSTEHSELPLSYEVLQRSLPADFCSLAGASLSAEGAVIDLSAHW